MPVDLLRAWSAGRTAARIFTKSRWRWPEELGVSERQSGEGSITGGVIGTLPAPILLVDRSGSCRHVSRGASDLLGVPASGLTGDGWLEHINPEIADEVCWAAAAAQTNQTPSMMDVRAAPDPRRWLRLRFTAAEGDASGLTWVELQDVSAERTSRAEAGRASSLIQRFQDISGVGYWRYDEASETVEWSEATSRMFRAISESCVLSNEDGKSFYHPEDVERAYDTYRQTLDSGAPFSIETRVIRTDGAVRYLQVRGEADRNALGEITGLVGVVRDLTEEREEEAQKRRMEERLGLVLAASRNGIWDWGVGDETIYISERFREILGLRGLGDRVKVHDVWDLIHPDDMATSEANVISLLKGKSVLDLELRLRHADGSYRWAHVKVAGAAGPNGRASRIVGTIADITERKEWEEKLKRARREALDASRAKSEFVAMVSHEIRTPMNGVIGMLELLNRSELSTEQKPLADTARESARALLDIVDDVLDFSKLEAGRIEIHPESFDLSALVSGVVDLFRPRTEARGIGLDVEWQTGMPPAVVADPARLRQILLNFVSNAVKFTEHGGVTIGARWLPQRGNEGDKLRFEVADTGPGIEAGQLRKLFQPFSQVSNEGGSRFGGTGLGLAISKRLAELMGGAVGVESTPGQGSRFWFEIGVHKCEPEQCGETQCSKVAGTHPVVTPLPAHVPAPVLTGTPLSQAERETRAAADREIPERLASHEDGVAAQPRPTRVEDQPALAPRQPSVPQASPQPQSRAPSSDGSDWPSRPFAGDAAQGAGKGHLLIAEDNNVNQRVLSAMLSKLGYTYEIVEDGAQAVEAARKGNFDAILMDIQMPRVDGVMATRLIREEERDTGARLPIIAITAHAIQGKREEYLSAGMSDYVTKPIDVRTLATSLARLCPGPAGTIGNSAEKRA